MRASEYLEAWKHPADYGGFSPDGDYVILSRHRDSFILEDSNWHLACKTLGAEPYDPEGPHCGATLEDYPDRPPVYHFRAGHWAVGWVEYLLVRADAPDDIKEAAKEIVCSLADYPCLDEEDYSNRQWESATERWQCYSTAERVDLLRDCGLSIFAARRDEFPVDDLWQILERLAGD